MKRHHNHITGEPWACLSKIEQGQTLIADGGFTCLIDGEECFVHQDEHFKLFVNCSGGDEDDGNRQGRHYLSGQADDGEHLVGFTVKP